MLQNEIAASRRLIRHLEVFYISRSGFKSSPRVDEQKKGRRTDPFNNYVNLCRDSNPAQLNSWIILQNYLPQNPS